ncbi:hypothetical protein CTEN210_15108 [Chaetoceros tenuissimus]|uniref:Uncharacterized protein n=1 Tax=Chaetoceros tenuissimus TaxID=426638 RepID=A0AAD3D652_9STRA|nr:hypothetical protein CTEN210_15108 [Chaetoceros tenuissimus]
MIDLERIHDVFEKIEEMPKNFRERVESKLEEFSQEIDNFSNIWKDSLHGHQSYTEKAKAIIEKDLEVFRRDQELFTTVQSASEWLEYLLDAAISFICVSLHIHNDTEGEVRTLIQYLPEVLTLLVNTIRINVGHEDHQIIESHDFPIELIAKDPTAAAFVPIFAEEGAKQRLDHVIDNHTKGGLLLKKDGKGSLLQDLSTTEQFVTDDRMCSAHNDDLHCTILMDLCDRNLVNEDDFFQILVERNFQVFHSIGSLDRDMALLRRFPYVLKRVYKGSPVLHHCIMSIDDVEPEIAFFAVGCLMNFTFTFFPDEFGLFFLKNESGQQMTLDVYGDLDENLGFVNSTAVMAIESIVDIDWLNLNRMSNLLPFMLVSSKGDSKAILSLVYSLIRKDPLRAFSTVTKITILGSSMMKMKI